MSATERLHDARGTGAVHIHQTENGDWYSVRHDGRDPNPQSDPWVGNVFIAVALGVGVLCGLALIVHAILPTVY